MLNHGHFEVQGLLEGGVALFREWYFFDARRLLKEIQLLAFIRFDDR